MSDKTRIETIVIRTTAKLPDWIIDAHLKPEGVHDIKIKTIHMGDQIQTLDKIKNLINDHWDDLPDEFVEAYEKIDGESIP